MARDWDLFVLPAAGFAVFGLTAARRIGDSPLSARCFDRYLAPALAMALAVVVPWVGINASETRSVQRYERIISMDTTNPGYGLEILAMHYGDQGDEKRKAETYDKAFAVSKNPRYLMAACSARLKYGEIDGPAQVLKDYLETNPGYHLAREVYIEALVRKGDMDGVIRVCREGIDRGPERPYYYLYLGIGHYNQGDIGKARAAFDECLRRDPPTVMVNAIKGLLANPPRQDATH
jgi:tetratricopeptide (TPR) repeat protein